MIKTYLLIFVIFKLIVLPVNAENDFSIALKINNKIITNHDIATEKKFLKILTPQIKIIDDVQLSQLAKKSLIKEFIKEEEILKYYVVRKDSDYLKTILKKIYTDLGFVNEENFKKHLLSFNLSLEGVINKLAIEAAWNKLIFDKYRGQIKVDEVKIKKKLNEAISQFKKQKLFKLSEIYFVGDTKKEFDENYQNIVKSIEEVGFKNTAILYSISDTSKTGGEIGWIKGPQLSDKIFEQVKKLNKNEYTKAMVIPGGNIIIRLDDIKEEDTIIDYDAEFKKFIAAEKNRQLNQFSNILFKRIKKNADIDES